MKNLISVVALVVLVGSSAFAQGKLPGPAPQPLPSLTLLPTVRVEISNPSVPGTSMSFPLESLSYGTSGFGDQTSATATLSGTLSDGRKGSCQAYASPDEMSILFSMYEQISRYATERRGLRITCYGASNRLSSSASEVKQSIAIRPQTASGGSSMNTLGLHQTF
ncbi:MAG: hypothetical protein JNL01_15675 [Bdellovibrionales bacterium]|nr:hypothetical protein [Bdellovibrionales bacterium]